MPIPRLDAASTALIVVDVQERLVPTIVDRERLANNCAVLLRMSRVLEIPSIVTEQYVQGLGRTVDTVAEAMPDPSWRIEKTRFSALIDLVDERLQAWRRQTVLLCGIEAHVCVLQTAIDLLSTGRQVFVCTDAISAMYELMGDARHPAFRQCLELAKAISG